jgi:hypothetical protein
MIRRLWLNILKLSKHRKLKARAPLFVAGAFAIGGLIWLNAGSAASYVVHSEAEAGTVAGSAGPGMTNGASGNASIKFGLTLPPPPPPPPPAGPGAIIFQDDFNGTAGSAPDQSKWRDYGECVHPYQAYGWIRCAGKKELNGQGQLVLHGKPTLGSAIMTAGKFGFKHGTITAWIKIPSTTGYWPAFWTENRPTDFSNVPLYGEVDTLEAYTWEPQYAHSNGIHAWGPNGQIWGGDDNYCTLPGNVSFANAYHKFTSKFEPTRITSWINDVQCGRAIEKTAGNPWPWAPDVNRDNYLILNLAIGGAGGRQPVPPKDDVMLVERVEVRNL